jgi:hypothetical protein
MDKRNARNSVRIGWTLSFIGFVLLLALGNVALVPMLVAVATILALGVMMVHNHKGGHMPNGLK